ncbi:HAD domain phosphoesterase family swiss army knife RNA repair protein, partial [Deltaproteobacteria bacterium]|nr:HAD domain phosphoesterase family swiss army knife RNA repair protein [Deltaproteobacteria bacterium]
VKARAKASISAGHVYTCICTGRQQKVEPRLKEILRSGGLSFDALFLKPGGDTASFKKKVLSGLVRKFPGAVIHFWEDRHDHLRSFIKHIESEGGVGVPHPVPEQYGVVMCGPEELGMAKSASSTRVAHRFLTRKTARGAKEVIPWIQQELDSGKEWEWHVWGEDSDGEETLWTIHGRGDGYYSVSYADPNAYGGWRTQFTYEADVKKLSRFRPFIEMKSVSWDQRKASGLPLSLRPDYGQSDEPQRGDDSDFTKEGSTGAECEFYLATDGQWYMGLSDHPPDDEEEREYWDPEMDYYGPFTSLESAEKFLRSNFANPGGSYEDSSGRRKPPKKPFHPRGRRRWASHKQAFNKYNPDELLSALVEVLEKYELEDAVDDVKKLTPRIQKAWRGRER